MKFKPMEIIKTALIKQFKLDEILKYVKAPNELDYQMEQSYKTQSKHGKSIESLEKKVESLEVNSHPPIFSKKDLVKLKKRIEKMENKCQTSKKK